MAYQTMTLPSFSGVRTDLAEGLMKPDMSPDAVNADTRTGALCSAGGFSRVMPEPCVDDRPFERMYVYAAESGNRYFVAAQDMLYLYDATAGIWRPLYQFERDVTGERMDFLRARVGTADKLLIACGEEPMIAFDAGTNLVDVFGTEQKQSYKTVSYIELYFGRLFAAGDPQAPGRLYWSKAPGSGRTIDDWRSDEASENVSGGFADVGVDDDPITGIFALSNQLLALISTVTVPPAAFDKYSYRPFRSVFIGTVTVRSSFGSFIETLTTFISLSVTLFLIQKPSP